MNFEAAISDARRIVSLFQKIPLEVLKELPQQQLGDLENQANSVFKIFEDALEFRLNQPNPAETRQNILNQVQKQYAALFPKLHPWIAYGVARTVDFNGLDAEARAIVKKVDDRAQEMEERFEAREQTINGLEEQLRTTLAEQGVSQQAKYFGDEADRHSAQAGEWANAIRFWAVTVAVAAFISFFTHRLPWIAPQNVAEAVQFIAAKILLVGALTYMLVRSSKNYAAHRHSEVINRHKQNSLLTFNALVEAGSTPETRNTVLNHAAASIYVTPDSGYFRTGTDSGPSNTTLVELLPRVPSQLADG